MKQFIVSAVVVMGMLWSNGEAKACGEGLLEVRARQAVSDDAAMAQKAITALRNAGPAGLAALFEVHAEALMQKPSPQLCAVFDAVAQQKDSIASRLYWYTDLDKAKAAAKASGKPILSLRLLGKLDEEFSCANSRFFRTVLYANADVSKTLREHFVLHWQSERPVPKVTIDFGDGRVLERTVTGNSIHYILDADGRPVDALPGLYGPRAFLRGLAQAEEAVKLASAITGEERVSLLRQWHDARAREIDSQRATDLAKIGAAEADDSSWKKIAALHRDDARLDAGSRALMAAKNPDAFDAGRVSPSKAAVENPLLRVVRTFERSLAEDTIRNEYILHRQLHDWFATATWNEMEVLNRKVYAQLFLTPRSDPWLGLVSPNDYTALNDGGLRKER